MVALCPTTTSRRSPRCTWCCVSAAAPRRGRRRCVLSSPSLPWSLLLSFFFPFVSPLFPPYAPLTLPPLPTIATQTDTKPKKAKHHHKSVKLATLKYYQVDEDGKVTRSRKDCPQEDCGAGVRMAVHKNRMHCGKCSFVLFLDK